MSTLEEIKALTEGHTEGPLVVDDTEQTVRVGYAGEILFDKSGEDRSYWARECRPNAELIAAAPKLLAALEAVEVLHVRHLGKWTDSSGIPWIGDHCTECRDEWPCDTAEAITEALA